MTECTVKTCCTFEAQRVQAYRGTKPHSPFHFNPGRLISNHPGFSGHGHPIRPNQLQILKIREKVKAHRNAVPCINNRNGDGQVYDLFLRKNLTQLSELLVGRTGLRQTC